MKINRVRKWYKSIGFPLRAHVEKIIQICRPPSWKRHKTIYRQLSIGFQMLCALSVEKLHAKNLRQQSNERVLKSSNWKLAYKRCLTLLTPNPKTPISNLQGQLKLYAHTDLFIRKVILNFVPIVFTQLPLKSVSSMGSRIYLPLNTYYPQTLVVGMGFRTLRSPQSLRAEAKRLNYP